MPCWWLKGLAAGGRCCDAGGCTKGLAAGGRCRASVICSNTIFLSGKLQIVACRRWIPWTQTISSLITDY